MARKGRVWGNALGGYRLQPRIRGRFAKRRGAKSAYRSRKKANAKAHRSRMKGSGKARVRETFTTMPKRSRKVAVGAVAYSAGRYSGSKSLQSYGLAQAKEGVRGGAGRIAQTRAMSKGLKRSRNRKAKDDYYRSIGTSRAKRNAMKTAAAVGVVAAGAVAYKKGGLYAERDYNYGFVSAGRGARYGQGDVALGLYKSASGKTRLTGHAFGKQKTVDLSGASTKFRKAQQAARKKAGIV